MPKRYWTEAEDQLLHSLKAERVPALEIAARMGRTIGAVTARSILIGARCRPFENKNWSAADDEALTKLYLAHFDLREISNSIGRTPAATRLRVFNLGLVRDSRKTRLASRYGIEVLAKSADPVMILAEIAQERADAVAREKSEHSRQVNEMLESAAKAIDAGCERDFIFTAAIVSGATLQQIGDKFGITRERVRQIIERRKAATTSAPGSPVALDQSNGQPLSKEA